MIQIGLYPHKCRNCGRKFEARTEYAYKTHRFRTSDDYDWFCSYRCLREYEQAHVTQRKPSARDEEILGLLSQGLCLMEIGKRYGISHQAVARIRDKWYERLVKA